MATTSSMSAVPLDRLLDSLGDQSLDADRAVVGADDVLVAEGPELVLPEHQVLVAEADDPDHVGAGLLVAARLREDRRHAQAAADADDLLRVPLISLGMPIGPTRPYSVRADSAVLLHLPGRLADRLDDQRDRAGDAVEVGDGQRDALTVLVQHDDDELARPRRLGHQRMAHLEQVGDVGEVLPLDDLEVGHGGRFLDL